MRTAELQILTWSQNIAKCVSDMIWMGLMKMHELQTALPAFRDDLTQIFFVYEHCTQFASRTLSSVTQALLETAS